MWSIRSQIVLLMLLEGCASAANAPSGQWISIPERELYPVMDRNPAYTGQAGWEKLPIAPVNADRMVSVRSWAIPDADRVSSLERSSSSAPSRMRIASTGTGFDTLHKGDIPEKVAPNLDFRPVEEADRFSTGAKPWASSSQSSSGPFDHTPTLKQLPEEQGWVPFQVGAKTFALQAYPLDTPLFRHLYESSSLRPWSPWNFEDFIVDGAFYSTGIRFQPVPAVLGAIRQTIWYELQRIGLRPRRIAPSFGPVEGDYLLPPLHVSAKARDQLDIPSTFLTQRIRQLISHRIPSHSARYPSLFHLEVTVENTVRHILMLPTRSERLVDISRQPSDSELWVFFEGMRLVGKEHTFSNRLAFLGVTFLPLGAKRTLLSANVIKVALPSCAGGWHP